MSNETYDLLKKIALYVIPFIAFIGSMLSIWNIPNSELWTATLTAIDTLIGSIVAISNKVYNNKIDEQVEIAKEIIEENKGE